MSDETKDTKESKLDKFIRLATARHVKTLKQLELLQNLGNSSYTVDPERAEKMVTEIEYEVKRLRKKWKLEASSSAAVNDALDEDENEDEGN